jgi:hypothetical protein
MRGGAKDRGADAAYVAWLGPLVGKATMKTPRYLLHTFLFLPIAVALAAQLRADDWPAWRGRMRDGICREKGLLKDWPTEGPKLLWKATGLGVGNSGPAIVGNVLYIMGEKEGKEWVMAFDVGRQGKPIWASAIGTMTFDDKSHPGPRATPSIDGDRLYTMGVGCFGSNSNIFK